MFYIIILLIWIAEIIIIPFCSDSVSILIISSPFFITIPIVISSLAIIPLIILAFLVIAGVILSILIIYQIMTEVVYS
ncbi:MAG: hypothetical protein ACTSPY_00340 [Candidatus Helarchaeota archaeon]